MAQYFWNEHYNAVEVSPFPTTWKNVAVSNPTPAPGEDITITGELWRYLGGPEDPVTTGVALVIDEYEVTRTTLGTNGRFSITIRASYVTGPYTYWPCVVYDRRYNGVVFRENHGPPIGIEVMSEFVCPWCGATFPSKELLDAHKAVCPYRPTEFVCPWCDAVFATEEELEAHKLVCPQRPTPVPWGNVLLYGSLGLIGIGLLWAVIRWVRK